MAGPYIPSQQPRPTLAIGVSVLVHLLVLLWMVWSPSLPTMSEAEHDSPSAISIEIVPEPAQQAGKKTSPAPPPEAEIIPQLEEAPVAKALVSAPSPRKREEGKGAISVPGKPLTRSERDVILSQALRRWKPPPQLMAYPDAAMTLKVTVRADGSLAAPFTATAPWNPAAAIDGYDKLPPNDLSRQTSEAFYRALREAQPFRLPAAMVAKAPFDVKLTFRYRDVR